MRIVQLGEQKGIGATMTFIQCGDKNIVIDCGIGFEKNGTENLKIIPSGNFLPRKRIDMIIITHSHVDHIGAIARLVGEHPEAIIIISKSAYALAEVMLNDSLKIYKNEFRDSSSNGQDYDILFDDKDLYNFLDSEQIEFIDEPCWIDTIWTGWSFGFYWSGHAVGAMMVMISAPNEPPLFITGDIASHNQEIVPGVMLPPPEFTNGFLETPGLIMVTEGTNGAKQPSTMARDQIKESLIKTMMLVQKRGGITLLPAFAQTKASNLVMMAVEAGIPVHIDGLARQTAPLEIPNFNELVDLGKISIIQDREEGKVHRELLSRGQDPCGHDAPVIISPSGALEPSFGIQHAQYILPGPKNAIIFTGYTFPHSTAKQVLEIERGRTLNFRSFQRGTIVKVLVDVRCDVHHFDLPSHDHAESLVERVRRVHPKHVCIHHCDKISFNTLSAKIAGIQNPPIIHWLKHNKELKFK